MLSWALPFAPRWLKDRSLLKNVRFARESVRGVTVKLAETEVELEGAARLVHDSYVRRGLIAPHPSGFKFQAHAALPTSLTFVAKEGERVVGTISLVPDSSARLPMDGTYADVLDRLRAADERFAEVTSLAVAPSHRGSGVFYLLNRIMIRSAIALGLDRVVVALDKAAGALYEVAMLFEQIGPGRHYAGLNRSAFGVALALRCTDLADRFRARFAHLGETPANAHHLYFEMACPEVLQPSRQALEPNEARTAAYVALARSRIDVFRALPEDTLAHFRTVLPSARLPSRSSMDLEEHVGMTPALAAARA